MSRPRLLYPGWVADDTSARFVEAASGLDLTYPEIGASWIGELPHGYVPGISRAVVGSGRGAYEAGIEAMAAWQHFDLGWVRPLERPPLAEGSLIAFSARSFGLTVLNACRVVRVSPTRTGPSFGYSYGTVGAHAERGEERFLLEFDETSGDVVYSMHAFARHARWWSTLGGPVVQRLRRKFRDDSTALMRRLVS